MQKKEVAVIDIRSSKITAIIAKQSVNNTFDIKYSIETPYSRFSEGKFENSIQVKEILQKMAIKFQEYFSNKEFDLYIGVPGCFTRIDIRDLQLSFGKKKRITKQDESKLLSSTNQEGLSGTTIIHCSPIRYELDDFRRLYNPIGEVSETLRAKVSFVYCSNYFINIVKSALGGFNLMNLNFISTPLAESIYLIPEEERVKTALLLDVGDTSTTFSIIQGSGLLYSKSIDDGGGILTCNLVPLVGDNPEVDPEKALLVAETIKRKTSLSTQYSVYDIYEHIDGLNLEVKKAEIKQALITLIEDFSDNVYKLMAESKLNFNSFGVLNLTGGGITYLRGAKEILSHSINMPINVVSPNTPHYDRPTNSSFLSLLNYVFNCL